MPISLGFLEPVLSASGPFATVFMDAGRAVEQADTAIERRWRALRDGLLHHGAPEAVAEALDQVMGVKSDLPGDQMQFAIANADAVLLDDRVPTPPVPDLAAWSPLPEIMPLLRLLPTQTPYLTVRIDRKQAQIRTYGPGGETGETVTGSDFPITKVHAGGWSEARYQRSAEDTWEHNAREVAEHVETQTSRHAPRVIVVSGDVHARTALKDALSDGTRPLVHEIDSEIDADQLHERALDHVRSMDRAADTELMGTFEQERASGRRAVAGLAATAQRLWQGQVETLVLVDYPEARTRLWAGPGPGQLAVTADDIRQAGEEPVEVRADTALIRAAAATGANLLIVDRIEQEPPITVDDGVGAILRY